MKKWHWLAEQSVHPSSSTFCSKYVLVIVISLLFVRAIIILFFGNFDYFCHSPNPGRKEIYVSVKTGLGFAVADNGFKELHMVKWPLQFVLIRSINLICNLKTKWFQSSSQFFGLISRSKSGHLQRGRHCSVYLSASTILQFRVQIPSTPSMLFTFSYFVLYLSLC